MLQPLPQGKPGFEGRVIRTEAHNHSWVAFCESQGLSTGCISHSLPLNPRNKDFMPRCRALGALRSKPCACMPQGQVTTALLCLGGLPVLDMLRPRSTMVDVDFPHIVIMNICQHMIYMHFILIDTRRESHHTAAASEIVFPNNVDYCVWSLWYLVGCPAACRSINTETNWTGLLKDNEPWSMMMLSHGLKPKTEEVYQWPAETVPFLHTHVLPSHHHTYYNAKTWQHSIWAKSGGVHTVPVNTSLHIWCTKSALANNKALISLLSPWPQLDFTSQQEKDREKLIDGDKVKWGMNESR